MATATTTDKSYLNTLDTMFGDLEGLFDILCRAGSPTSSVGSFTTGSQRRTLERTRSRSIACYLGQFPDEDDDEDDEEQPKGSDHVDGSGSEDEHLTTYRRLKISSVLWFYPTVLREQAKEMLKGKDVGTFLVRNSTRVGNFALSVRLPDGLAEIENYLIRQTENGLHLDGVDRYFPDLEALVAFYVDTPSDGFPCHLILPGLILSQDSERSLRAVVRKETERRALSSLRAAQAAEASDDTTTPTMSPVSPVYNFLPPPRSSMDVNDHRRSRTIASSAPSAGAAHVRELFSGRSGHYFSIDSANYATTISYDANLVRPFPSPLTRSYTMASVEALKHERKEGKKLSKTRTFLSAVVGKLTKSKQRKKKKKKKDEESYRFHCHVDGCQLEERPRQPSPPPLPGRAENHGNEIATESSSESLIDSNDEEDEEEEEDENDGTNDDDDDDDDDDGINNDDTLPSFPLPPPSPLSPSPPPVPPRPASLANRLDLLPTPTMYSSIDLTDSGPVTPSSVFSGGHFPPPVPPRRSQSAIDPPVLPPHRLPLFNPPRRRHSYGSDSLYALPVEEMRRRARLLTAIHEDESTSFPRQRASSFDASALLRHDYELPNWRRFSVGGHTYVSINGSIVRAVGAFSDASSLKSFEAESVGSELPPSVSRSGSFFRDRKLRHRRSRSCDDLRILEEKERESELLESVVQDMSDNVQEWFRTASFREEEERDEVKEDEAELPLKSEATATAAAGGEGILLLDPDLLLTELSIKEDHFRNSFVESAISLDSQPRRNRDDTVSRRRKDVATTRNRVESRRKGVKNRQKEAAMSANGRELTSPRNRILHTASKLLLVRQKTKKSPSRHIRMQLEKAAGNRNGKFGHNVDIFLRNHKDSTVDPHNLVKVVRDFMNQLKEYLLLVNDSELATIVGKQQHIENVELDAVVEGALVQSILKPLYKTIQKNFTQFYKRSGATQQFASCLDVAIKLSSEELRIRDGLIPPQGPSLDHIRVHFQKMQSTHSPLVKLEHLLAAVDIVYQTVTDVKNAHAGESLALGADDFLPIFIWVLVHTRFERAEFESEYLWGLLDPALMTGEGGYYLTTLSGAVMVIKQIAAKPKKRSRRLPCIGDLQGLLRVEVPVDSLATNVVTCFKTFQIGQTTTAEEACALISAKLKIKIPKNYRLFQVIDDEAIALRPDVCPQVIKMEWTLKEVEADETDAPTVPRYFSFRRLKDTAV